MKKLLIGLLALVMLLGACTNSGTSGQQTTTTAAVQSGGQTTAASGGTTVAPTTGLRSVLKVGLDVDVGIMDPRLARETSTARINEMIYDGLIDLDANQSPVPCLATSWENPEPTVWIFHLREGVVFSNGQEFGAEDVKHTYETIMDENFQSPSRSAFTSVESVEAVDNLTVKFTLKQPYAPMLVDMTRGIVPRNSEEMTDFGQNPIGTGPYVVTEVSKNNRVIVQANPTYWGEAAKTATIEFYIIPDNTTRVAALEAGDIDLIHSPLTPQDITRMKGNDKFVVLETPSLALTYLDYNITKGALADVRVRQAIAYLTDKETIARDIYKGMDTPAGSILLPTSWAFTDTIKGYSFDPAKAKALLEEAGYAMNSDGFYYKDGQKLVIQLMTHTEDPNRIQAIEFIQNTLQMNGVDAEVSTYEWATFVVNVQQQKDFEIALMGLVSITDPDKYIYLRFRSGAANNDCGLADPELDAYVDEARSTSDIARRTELYQKAAQIVNDNVAHDVLLYQGYIVIHSNKLSGFTPMPTSSWRGLEKVTIAE